MGKRKTIRYRHFHVYILYFIDGIELDADNPTHVEWVHNAAMKRADEYGIRGVDYRLVQGVLKRIIPAVASTNAIIAGNIYMYMHIDYSHFCSIMLIRSCQVGNGVRDRRSCFDDDNRFVLVLQIKWTIISTLTISTAYTWARSR